MVEPSFYFLFRYSPGASFSLFTSMHVYVMHMHMHMHMCMSTCHKHTNVRELCSGTAFWLGLGAMTI